MANFVYDKARQHFLEGSIHWLTDTIKAQLIDTASYNVNNNPVTSAGTNSMGYAQGNHQYLSDIPTAARISAPQTLGSKTSSNGNADAGDLAFPAVTPAGTSIEAIVLYRDSGTATTSQLIAYLDVITGFPIIANGGTINVSITSTRIFRI